MSLCSVLTLFVLLMFVASSTYGTVASELGELSVYALFVLLIQFLKKQHLSFVKFCFIFVWYIKFCIYWLNESTIKLACCVISIKRVDIHFKFFFIDGTFYSTVREFNVTERQ